MRYKLSDIATYISEKINTNDIDLKEYISTENMLPDKGGIALASSLPSTPKTNSFNIGDVLFSNIRTYFRKIWFATFVGGVSTDVLVFRSKDTEILYDKYLYYLLSEEAFIQYTVTSAKGTKMPRGDKSAIMNYEIELPPLPTQKKIAHILSTLDDKIELNRKMNQTLEEMAQAIFKSWFMDFDPVHAKMACGNEEALQQAAKELGISKEILKLFPNEFEESELGMIPKGWRAEMMKNIISVKDGTHDSPKPKDNGYPLVTSKHIKNGEIELTTPNLISQEDFDKVNQRSKVEQYDILIGMIGTIGDLYLVADKKIDYAIKNVGLFKTSEIEILSEYIYYWLDTSYMRNYIVSRLAGTTQKYISLTELRNVPVVLPTDEIIAQFRKVVGNILSIKNLNFNNTKELQKTRDTLLPKLLSGELDVSNINL